MQHRDLRAHSAGKIGLKLCIHGLVIGPRLTGQVVQKHHGICLCNLSPRALDTDTLYLVYAG